jgi:hypothetical protein
VTQTEIKGRDMAMFCLLRKMLIPVWLLSWKDMLRVWTVQESFMLDARGKHKAISSNKASSRNTKSRCYTAKDFSWTRYVCGAHTQGDMFIFTYKSFFEVSK